MTNQHHPNQYTKHEQKAHGGRQEEQERHRERDGVDREEKMRPQHPSHKSH